MTATVHANTPQLSVIDSRGLVVRQVGYWRRDVSESTPESRITAQQHDAAGRLAVQRDPRFLAPAARPNMTTAYSLSGKVLLTDSIDAGWRLGLPGEAGAMQEAWDGRGSHWQNEYDKQQRPVALHEQTRGSGLRTLERLTYAGNTPGFAERNQCGQLIRHDDTAGTLHSQQFGLLGALLVQKRHFLKTLQHADWPSPLDARDELLEPGDGFQTRRRYSPGGELLCQADARGHRQSWYFDLTGQLRLVHLQLKDETTGQTILHSLSYNALGQIESQTCGNGTTTRSQFDPANGRLLRLLTDRVGRDRLQDLSYLHDAGGNVVKMQDHTQPTRYFANQMVEAINLYTYDSLSQLISANGREALGQSIRPELPELAPDPGDSSRLLNYTEHYDYDRGGNLILLRHESAHPGQAHRRAFKVAEDSNRALPWDEQRPPDFVRGFDTNGNLQHLNPHDRNMLWNGQNQLQKITQISRQDGDEDAEYYVYDHQHLRVRKQQCSVASGVTHVREVRYLPGLEIRTQDDSEHLEVITVQTARGQVRCLHWVTPPPDDIQQDQLRYSLNDHLVSSTLELDGQADIISHEGYYPYGGTAWWAARNEVEARYKTVRYSGKERDASGLYDYGLRYYAPWLCRWTCPDPAGTSDGLNVYGFCGNNPIGRIDRDGQTWGQYFTDVPSLNSVLGEFLDNEQSLIHQYGITTITPGQPEQDDDEASMSDPGSPDSSHSSASSGDSTSPDSPTAIQYSTLDDLQGIHPEFYYRWNEKSLLMRGNFGTNVYRADRREPQEIAQRGFNPSDEFTAVKKMIHGDALIVSASLEGVLHYATQSKRKYYIYEIDASEISGVSLIENLVSNSQKMYKHLDISFRIPDMDVDMDDDSDMDTGPSYTLFDHTGDAHSMDEVHLSHEEVTTLDSSQIRSLGTVEDGEQRIRDASRH
jgi:insecticidal toxin complex protein TccC